VDLPVLPPVAPMLAKAVAEIPADHFYEPKWDGFRSIVFRDGDQVEIGSRGEKPMTRYFPELVEAIRANLPPRCVLDGEIVVAGADQQGLDFFLLQQRIHPAASRVSMLAEKTPATFIAFDLLALDDIDYTERPFAERRAVLERVLAPAAPPIHLTPITTDISVARRWFEVFEGAGLDGLIAKPADLTYQPNKRVMFKIKHERTVDCVLAGYRTHKSSPELIGSLLLGLYDDIGAWDELREWVDLRGGLAPVGVIGAFPMVRRKEMFIELQPLVTEFAGHPWEWAVDIVDERLRRREGASRWNNQKDPSFVPLRPERVVEARYDYMAGFRFRHPAQFVRWRPDRDPASCYYSQLETPARYDLRRILAGQVT
jgi:ATP-dependent DNA ligase